MDFSKLGLSEAILQGVYASGYSHPTEIQSKAIPAAIAGHDLIGCAPTGTGKTAAFVLPMLHALEGAQNGRRHDYPRALVLTPTRELAGQIDDAIREYGSYCTLRSLPIYGGVNMNRQLKELEATVDIIVATPGRLIDHLDRGSIDLSHIEILVLDEADRMFDMGFIRDVRKIVGRVPPQRQTLLFSATISKEVRMLAADVQHHPHTIDIGVPCKPAETVEQRFYGIAQPSKNDLLIHVLKSEEVSTALVFSRTKHGADRIARKLHRAGIRAEAIHSDRSQSQRERTLSGFREHRFDVLVATDVAARGIDVEGISHVFNFDTPRFAEDYIHRIGRSGRAEHRGTALTFVSSEEQEYFRKIEKLVGKRFDLGTYPGFTAAAPVSTTAAAPVQPAPFRPVVKEVTELGEPMRRQPKKVRFFGFKRSRFHK